MGWIQANGSYGVMDQFNGGARGRMIFGTVAERKHFSLICIVPNWVASADASHGKRFCAPRY